MKIQHKVIILSISLGIFVGLLDALVDFFFLRQGESFWESLVYGVPAFGIYLRASALTVFVIFGMIMANILTKEKQAEEKVAELYQREKELHQNLENEIKRRVEFNRALVHELKTPLVPIVAASELLVGGVPEEQAQRLAKSIQRGASTMNNRIDRLLDMARGELGMLVFEDGEVDILKLLQQVAEDMSPVAVTRELSMVLELPSSLPLIWADKGRLEQVITNLLSNALKFTP